MISLMKVGLILGVAVASGGAGAFAFKFFMANKSLVQAEAPKVDINPKICIALSSLAQTIAEKRDDGIDENDVVSVIQQSLPDITEEDQKIMALTVDVIGYIYDHTELTPDSSRSSILARCNAGDIPEDASD